MTEKTIKERIIDIKTGERAVIHGPAEIEIHIEPVEEPTPETLFGIWASSQGDVDAAIAAGILKPGDVIRLSTPFLKGREGYKNIYPLYSNTFNRVSGWINDVAYTNLEAFQMQEYVYGIHIDDERPTDQALEQLLFEAIGYDTPRFFGPIGIKKLDRNDEYLKHKSSYIAYMNGTRRARLSGDISFVLAAAKFYNPDSKIYLSVNPFNDGANKTDLPDAAEFRRAALIASFADGYFQWGLGDLIRHPGSEGLIESIKCIRGNQIAASNIAPLKEYFIRPVDHNFLNVNACRVVWRAGYMPRFAGPDECVEPVPDIWHTLFKGGLQGEGSAYADVASRFADFPRSTPEIRARIIEMETEMAGRL